jgi:hypothetical protein
VGSLSSTLAIRCTQPRCSRVSGQPSRAADPKSSAPSPMDKAGARMPRAVRPRNTASQLSCSRDPRPQWRALLRSLGPDTDDHQSGEAILFQSDIEMDPIDPDIDKVSISERLLPPAVVLRPPRGGQAGNRRGRQARPRPHPGARAGRAGNLRWTSHAGSAACRPALTFGDRRT